MKEVRAVLPDELVHELEARSKRLGIPVEELITQSLAAYLPKLELPPPVDPVGYGMWKDREDFLDSITWVRKLRDHEWTR